MPPSSYLVPNIAILALEERGIDPFQAIEAVLAQTIADGVWTPLLIRAPLSEAQLRTNFLCRVYLRPTGDRVAAILEYEDTVLEIYADHVIVNTAQLPEVVMQATLGDPLTDLVSLPKGCGDGFKVVELPASTPGRCIVRAEGKVSTTRFSIQ